MKTSDFYFHLPERLIAQEPTSERDESRLLALHRDGATEDRLFCHLPEYMSEGDMLLLNKTKVFPARLAGYKPTGGRLEILLVKNLSGDLWEILCYKKFTGRLTISDSLAADVYEGKTAELRYKGDIADVLLRDGMMPLPHYIRRRPEEKDKERYQTVYAEDEGSIAAPTAGLHFTEKLIEEIEAKGVLVRRLTLHVGKGTFIPVRAEDPRDHAMGAEHFEIPSGLIEEIKQIKNSDRRLFAVGTTATRAIEGFLSGRYQPIGNGDGVIRGTTDMFIYPGFSFKAVDCLITNFHLPASTPLMLASAFAGRERVLQTYEAAIKKDYRFFSYGDAMLLL